MSDRETRRKIIDAMVNVVRQKLGREAAPQISILRELLNATEALFEKGVGAPRKGRPELRRYNPSGELASIAKRLFDRALATSTKRTGRRTGIELDQLCTCRLH